jgi:predicted amidophosphoribosyltransferase
MLGTLLDLLFPPRDAERILRGEPEDCLLRFLDPVVTGSGITALLPYDEPLVRAAVLETKFHNNERASHLLGTVLAAYLKDELRERSSYEERPCILVPVPLSSVRLRERGHNQAATIARHAAAALSLPLDTSLLIRTRDTVPQTSLAGTARRRNLYGAFALALTPNPAYLYIVIDDVITTGSTLGEVGKVFTGAVILIALAHSDSHMLS